MFSDGRGVELDAKWDAVVQGAGDPAVDVDPVLSEIVARLADRDRSLGPVPAYAESLWEDLMSSTVLARPNHAQLMPTTEESTVWSTPRRFGWNAGHTGRRVGGIISAVGVVAILVVAVYATLRLSGLSIEEAHAPASFAAQTSTEHEPLVGSWIVRSPWMSRNDPPLLMTFGSDGTMLVTDRSADNTGHGHWTVTSEGVAFELITIELAGNGDYSGMTTAHGEISIAQAANEWTGVYRTFLTTPAGNVPTAMVDTEINGERIVAEPPRGPDQGPATPEPRS